MGKPDWVIDKERRAKAAAQTTHWLFGLHAVRDALVNPARHKHRLVVTKNAALKLTDAISQSGLDPEICDARVFSAPLDHGSVHQGAALETKPLNWGAIDDHAIAGPSGRLVLLDRVTDPHNVGAVLRSAEVFGAAAVVGIRHHSAPETGALAKAASGALERQPYLRERNLSDTIRHLQGLGYCVLGFDGAADLDLDQGLRLAASQPLALVFGAEGPGLRQKTRESCDALVRITPSGAFGSLNVSNAVAVALYAARATS